MTELAKWIMPPELKEISGLALTSRGTVFTHDDNVATCIGFVNLRGNAWAIATHNNHRPWGSFMNRLTNA